MVETRSVSFKDLGWVVGPGKEIWGPRRVTNEAYTKKCEEILEAEAKRRPLYRVSMSVDHASKNVVFRYLPIDFEYEAGHWEKSLVRTGASPSALIDRDLLWSVGLGGQSNWVKLDPSCLGGLL